MLRITICDDETTQLSLLGTYVTEWGRKQQIALSVETCCNAEQFLFAWEEKKDTDILLLDIEMPGLDGIALAKKLREKRDNVQIIFITGLSDYVFEGYEVDAVSYLLKPVKREQLFSCLARAKERCGRKEEELLLEAAGELVKVRLKDIVYLESDAHDTLVYLSETPMIRCHQGIRQMETLLREKGSLFFSIHRSYLVNLMHIRKITRKDIVMDDGQLLPIARGKWEELNRAYLSYYRSVEYSQSQIGD